MSAVSVEVRDARVFSRTVPLRMPFRFGNAVMDRMDVAHVELTIGASSGEAKGVGASVLSPLWFDKDPSRTWEEKNDALLRSLALAVEAILQAGAGSAFELHARAAVEARRCARDEGINELTAGFGAAVTDLALVDAACRIAGITFHAALRGDVLGVGEDVAAAIPREPLERIAVRHTVGLGDAITAGDIAAGQRLDDGLPETLEEVVREHGVSWFKIKIERDVEANLSRLRRIAAALDGVVDRDYSVTLDANEQFEQMGDCRDFVRAAAADPRLVRFWPCVAYVEQPVHRDRALSDDVAAALAEIPLPVIIDESDATATSFERARALGYAGVSAKSCKGVFRSVRHRCVPNALVSAEDLTCPPILPLHHDLCTAAALGLTHAERNGHHYVHGLDHLSQSEREHALRTYPRLYERRDSGLVTLRIRDGFVDVRDLNAHAFGVQG